MLSPRCICKTTVSQLIEDKDFETSQQLEETLTGSVSISQVICFSSDEEVLRMFQIKLERACMTKPSVLRQKEKNLTLKSISQEPFSADNDDLHS
jgi:hypothetical protein